MVAPCRDLVAASVLSKPDPQNNPLSVSEDIARDVWFHLNILNIQGKEKLSRYLEQSYCYNLAL